MSSDEIAETLEVRFTEADDYDTVPATDVMGGVQLNGDFHIDFLLNKTVTGGTEERALTQEGRIGDVVKDDTEFYLNRQKQIGIYMSQRQALNASTWIIAELVGEGTSSDDVIEVIQEAYPETFG